MLDELEDVQPDVVVFGGDLAAGALPRETIALARAVPNVRYAAVLTSDEDARKTIGEVEQPTVVIGHTHSQFDRRLGDLRLVNAGSVGMP